MADASDVEIALVGAALQTLYPLGLDQPCAIEAPVRVYRGWPIVGSLEADLTAGVANLSVFPTPNSGRNTTRWGPVVHVTPGVPTLVATVIGDSVSFLGAGGAGQVIGLLVDGKPFVHRGSVGDTPTVVAAVLAESVRAFRACWLSGAMLSIPGCSKLVARIVADATTLTEWGRQEQEFRLSTWCPDPLVRDRVCSLICASFASIAFLALADGSTARLTYRSTSSDDDNQSAHEYRRDLIYHVEYGTTQQGSAPAMLFGELGLTDSPLYA